MGSATGTSGTGKIPKTGESIQLSNVLTSLLKSAAPAQKEELNQLREALTTGGVGAKIPLIQRAIEAASVADAASSRRTSENLGRAGLTGTPFAVNTQASEATANTRAEAAIGPQIAAGLISQFAGVPGQTIGQMQDFQSSDLARRMFNSNQVKAFYEDLKDSLQVQRMGGGGTPQNNTQETTATPQSVQVPQYPSNTDQGYNTASVTGEGGYSSGAGFSDSSGTGGFSSIAGSGY